METEIKFMSPKEAFAICEKHSQAVSDPEVSRALRVLVSAVSKTEWETTWIDIKGLSKKKLEKLLSANADWEPFAVTDGSLFMRRPRRGKSFPINWNEWMIRDPSEYVSCKTCDGWGKVTKMEQHDCPHCKGSGMQDDRK